MTDSQTQRVFLALADPTRRLLLQYLCAEGSGTAAGFAARLPMTRQAIIKHLVTLERAGLVTARETGRERRYMPRPEALQTITTWMEAIEAQWDQRLAALQSYLLDEPRTPATPEEEQAIMASQKETQTMDNQNFTTTFLVDQTPREVFNAITNVRGWWSEEIEGATSQLNDEFIYRAKEGSNDVHYCKMKLVEVIPDKTVLWLVMYNYFNFVEEQSEWMGTHVRFDISQEGNRTRLRFTHEGLVPTFECYGVCSPAWTHYVQGSLLPLITTGKGHPNRKGEALPKVSPVAE